MDYSFEDNIPSVQEYISNNGKLNLSSTLDLLCVTRLCVVLAYKGKVARLTASIQGANAVLVAVQEPEIDGVWNRKEFLFGVPDADRELEFCYNIVPNVEKLYGGKSGYRLYSGVNLLVDGADASISCRGVSMSLDRLFEHVGGVCTPEMAVERLNPLGGFNPALAGWSAECGNLVSDLDMCITECYVSTERMTSEFTSSISNLCDMEAMASDFSPVTPIGSHLRRNRYLQVGRWFKLWSYNDNYIIFSYKDKICKLSISNGFVDTDTDGVVRLTINDKEFNLPEDSGVPLFYTGVMLPVRVGDMVNMKTYRAVIQEGYCGGLCLVLSSLCALVFNRDGEVDNLTVYWGIKGFMNIPFSYIFNRMRQSSNLDTELIKMRITGVI